MRLSRRLCPWLNGWFLVSEHHTNYMKIASAADFRSPRSSDQLRFWQASGHHPRTSDQATGYSCKQHRKCMRCTLYRCDKRSLTGQTERFFHYRWVVSHPRKHDWTRAHTHCATAVTITPPSTSGIRLQYAPVPSALNANSRCLLKLLALSELS